MKKYLKYLAIWVLLVGIVIIVTSAIGGVNGAEKKIENIPFSEFVQKVKAEQFKIIEVKDRTLRGEVNENTIFYTYAPSYTEIAWLDNTYLFKQIEDGKLELKGTKPSSGAFWNTLMYVVLIGACLFVLYFMMSQGGNGRAFQFAKSRARMVKSGDKKITFADVAGLKEEKQELEEIVDFLKDPRKYKELGARIPKGILLVGPPGTGKTYISKAAAGEAGVPFFTISGSDFVEMFVGVGASRVRDLFGEAKKNAPCIIFIDEIDAVGRKRGAGIGGGHDEREQTLNQLLVEMDGFAENSGIIILAATNRPDILDPALLRPGRFDRQVVIGIPDISDREQIFKIHSKNKPLAEDVTPKVLARRTPGFTPADIENLLNEAALITARRNGRFIRMAEIEEAITKVIAGPEKKGRVISEKARTLTAYHEAGHAVIARSIPGNDPVHQVTIIPRGRAGGFTMTLPVEDKAYETKTGMKNSIVELLGGRVAEQITLDDISTGASNDIMRATEIARDMVTKYGFSEKLGTLNYSSSEEVFLGNDFTTHKNYSEQVARDIDEEMKRIVEEAYAEATKILTENREILERVAQALLLVETLDGEQFEALYTGTMTEEEIKAAMDKSMEEKKERDEKEAREREEIRREEERRLMERLEKANAQFNQMDAENEEAIRNARVGGRTSAGSFTAFRQEEYLEDEETRVNQWREEKEEDSGELNSRNVVDGEGKSHEAQEDAPEEDKDDDSL